MEHITVEYFKEHILKITPVTKSVYEQNNISRSMDYTLHVEQALKQVELHLSSLDDSTNAVFHFRAMKAKRITNFSSKEQGWKNRILWCIENAYEVFVVVNQSDGLGVKKNNINKVRALFLDLDNTSIDNLAVIDNLTIKPNLVINTSPGKFHCYWTVKDCPLTDFTNIQKLLAKKFNGDGSVSDLPRIMRLAGSYNLKNKPYQVTIVNQHDEDILYSAFKSGINISSINSAQFEPIRKINDDGFISSKNTVEENIRNIHNGINLHASLLSLSGTWVSQGLSKLQIIKELELLLSKSNAERDERYEARLTSIPRLVDYVFGSKRQELEQNHKWTEPKPLVSELKSVLPLDVKILPKVMRKLVTDSAERMQCPPDFLAAGIVVAASSIIARNIVVQPKKRDIGWLVYLNLWGAIIGKPSLLKSPTLSIAMASLEKLESKCREIFVQELKEHKVECELAEMRVGSNKKKIKSLIQNGNFQLAKSTMLADQIADDLAPTQARYVINDGTIEKIADLLCTNTKGLLVFRDELSGWFNNLNKPDKANDRSFVLESWNGDKPYTIDRIGRGTTFIPTNRLSILGGIQPDAFAKVVDETIKGNQGGDGLLQRFQILVFPDVSFKSSFIDRAPNELAIREFSDIIQVLNDWSNEREDKLILKFNDAAYKLFKDWYTDNEVLTRSNKLSSALESHYAKYRSLLPTIASIFYVLDNHDFEENPYINEQCTSNAIAYVEYLRTHAERIYALQEQVVLKGAKAILARFDKLDDNFTESKIKRNKWSGLTDPNVVEAALALLEENGHCKMIERNNGVGRPSICFIKHPKYQLQKLRKLSLMHTFNIEMDDLPCKS